MIEWDEWLQYQALVTDAIDCAELEIKAYQLLEELLISHEKALQSQYPEIESYLASIHLIVSLKRLYIKRLESQFDTHVKNIIRAGR